MVVTMTNTTSNLDGGEVCDGATNSKESCDDALLSFYRENGYVFLTNGFDDIGTKSISDYADVLAASGGEGGMNEGSDLDIDVVYETINFQRVLTRVERFVHDDSTIPRNPKTYKSNTRNNTTKSDAGVVTIAEDVSETTGAEVTIHKQWSDLVRGDKVVQFASLLLGGPAVLFKEKLNFKPPGGKGFAPHLDTPSLQHYAPNIQKYVTVMVAIDDMTAQNGCLKVAGGSWGEGSVACVPPSGDPESGGRAGAITDVELERLRFKSLPCFAGSVLGFHGHVPHASDGNKSTKSRRAVFLTYNLATDGDYHAKYYKQLHDIREAFRLGWMDTVRQMEQDAEHDKRALTSIPDNV
eukprot:TRINITY_DN418_c0_g1_i2.p1 TRINITY_DN418_c0_g1~~TRINITY_DN418_c0_g1_i2.p1  ORF type:complete len:353 (-),score=57.16 TRINITY_DN418_c0_g1_i2:210-1268(-)